VYAENSATGVVHVSKSKKFDTDLATDWTYVEKVVLQVASATSPVELSSQHGWTVPVELEGALLSSKDNLMAQIEPAEFSMAQAVFTSDAFEKVREMGILSTEMAAKSLPCSNLGVGQGSFASLVMLRQVVGNEYVTRCSDVPWQMCSQMNMTQLRALCPEWCRCDRPPDKGAMTGFFGHAAYGCPAQCSSHVAAHSEYWYLEANSSDECDDLDYDEWIFVGTCGSTDYATTGDRDHDYCDHPVYVDPDGDACTLGTYDDDDFTARSMCCGCGGGTNVGVMTSLQCSENLTDNCQLLSNSAFYWVLYVNGLFEYLEHRAGFEELLDKNIQEDALNISVDSRALLKESILNGDMKRSLLDQSWDFMPGVEHPRNLTGCGFLTSWEFNLLLSIDLCSPDSFASIQRLCPVSCGCGPGSPRSQCPTECTALKIEAVPN
jgi:hypothetical protein